MPDYILTFTKNKFYPLDPVLEDIMIEDIAHALSLMTRANGHFQHFYSVGQHSINCYREAKARGYSKNIQLGCILHDASEAYLSDITRPVIRHLSEYQKIESKLQNAIYQKYKLNFTDQELLQIEEIDDAVLYHEFIALMGERIVEHVPDISLKHDFSLRDFSSVESEFLSLFKQLTVSKTGKSYVGIDGCKEGWVTVELTETDFTIGVYKKIDEICYQFCDSSSLIIDMPIGLTESLKDIRPDGEARGVLSSRASCVFNAPCRQAVYAEDYYMANDINKAVLGKGLSKQSFMIVPKIKEIDVFLEKNPEFQNKLIEAHPEVCFAMLNRDEKYKMPMPIFENKKTEGGIQGRVELLSSIYERTNEVIAYVQQDPKLKRMVDDVMDALCLAVTGMLSEKVGLKSIPEAPKRDNRNLLMQMVYVEKC